MVSFDFNIDSLMQTAVDVFNSIGGIFLVIGGITVGIGLARLVVKEVANAL